MISTMKSKAKDRRDYLAKLYAQLSSRVPAYLGATVTQTPQVGGYQIKLLKSTTDLKRFKDLQSSSSYLYMHHPINQVYALNSLPQDEGNGSLLCSSTSESGQWQVRFRKGDKNDKDVFVEVWSG
jgi:hypothetical protein